MPPAQPGQRGPVGVVGPGRGDIRRQGIGQQLRPHAAQLRLDRRLQVGEGGARMGGAPRR